MESLPIFEAKLTCRYSLLEYCKRVAVIQLHSWVVYSS